MHFQTSAPIYDLETSVNKCHRTDCNAEIWPLPLDRPDFGGCFDFVICACCHRDFGTVCFQGTSGEAPVLSQKPLYMTVHNSLYLLLNCVPLEAMLFDVRFWLFYFIPFLSCLVFS